MKTPWLIAVRPTLAVLAKHGKTPNTVEIYEAIRWWTSATHLRPEENNAGYLFMEMEAGPSIRWSFDLIDQVTITRRTEG